MKQNKVYTKIVWDYEGTVLEEDSTFYKGPWLLAAEGEEVEEVEESAEVSESPEVLEVMDADDDTEAEEVDPVQAAKETVEVEKEEVVEEEVEKEVVEEKVEAPLEKEAVKEEPKVEPVIETPAEARKTPDQMREEVVQQITENYKLSEEDAELLTTDPAKFMPMMAAKLHVDAYESTMYAIVSQLPKMVQMLVQSGSQASDRMQAFHDVWPALNNPEYAPKLAEVGAFWRGQNPTATKEEAIQGIGKLAMDMLGIKAPEPEPKEALVPTKPQPKVIIPSAPAASRTGAGGAAPTVEPNGIFEVLDFDDSEE